MDVSLRLRFIRSGDFFKIICTSDQRERMEKAIKRNGGRATLERMEEDSVFLFVYKAE